MGIFLERIDGLMPVCRKNVASTAGQALIYLRERVGSVRRTIQGLEIGRLTFAHGAEYRSFCGAYPDADSCAGQIEAYKCHSCQAKHTAALAPIEQTLVST